MEKNIIGNLRKIVDRGPILYLSISVGVIISAIFMLCIAGVFIGNDLSPLGYILWFALSASDAYWIFEQTMLDYEDLDEWAMDVIDTADHGEIALVINNLEGEEQIIKDEDLDGPADYTPQYIRKFIKHLAIGVLILVTFFCLFYYYIFGWTWKIFWALIPFGIYFVLAEQIFAALFQIALGYWDEEDEKEEHSKQ